MIERRAHIGIAFAVDLVAGENSTCGRVALRSTSNCFSSITTSFWADLISGRLISARASVSFRFGWRGSYSKEPTASNRRSPEERPSMPQRLAQAQIRVAQIRLRLNQLGLFIGERDFGAAGIQGSDQARRSSVRAGF